MYAIFLYNIAICYIFVSYILRTIGKSNWILYSCETLDIVQSFPLLSYCIVSPIYISPICNV